MSSLSEIAAVLKTTEGNALNRVVKMKLAVRYCGRCGGSGSYSFNGSHSRCYDCNGAGYPKPLASDFAAILDNAKAAAADGRLDTYLRFQEALRITKDATARVLKVWSETGISKSYDWTRSYKTSHGNDRFNQRDFEIANINAKMADVYNGVELAARKLNSKSETYQADVIALAEIVTAALATIEAVNEEYKTYLATH